MGPNSTIQSNSRVTIQSFMDHILGSATFVTLCSWNICETWFRCVRRFHISSSTSSCSSKMGPLSLGKIYEILVQLKFKDRDAIIQHHPALIFHAFPVNTCISKSPEFRSSRCDFLLCFLLLYGSLFAIQSPMFLHWLRGRTWRNAESSRFGSHLFGRSTWQQAFHRLERCCLASWLVLGSYCIYVTQGLFGMWAVCHENLWEFGITIWNVICWCSQHISSEYALSQKWKLLTDVDRLFMFRGRALLKCTGVLGRICTPWSAQQSQAAGSTLGSSAVSKKSKAKQSTECVVAERVVSTHQTKVHGFLDPKDGRSLVHMDLTTANIMWDPASLTLQLSHEVVGPERHWTAKKTTNIYKYHWTSFISFLNCVLDASKSDGKKLWTARYFQHAV